jgi:hypothetical protein
LFVASITSVLEPDGADFSGVVTLILVGVAVQGCRLAVAFATPAPPDPELEPDDVPLEEPAEPLELDELLELDEPQAASSRASANVANMAENCAMRGPRRLRLSALMGDFISRLSPLMVIVVAIFATPTKSSPGGCGAGGSARRGTRLR